MKLLITKACIIILLFAFTSAVAQQKSLQLPTGNDVNAVIDKIRDNKAISADSAFQALSQWSDYPVIQKTGYDYLYYFSDPFYGVVPVRVYVPVNYNRSRKSVCVLLLHGGTGGSKFADIDSLNKFDDDILFSSLKKQDYIIIRPVAENKKKFNWSVNMFSGQDKNATNLTFQTLTNIVISIKKVLNIDDNKVFAMGHSDGSDGAIGLGVYSPNLFAAYVAYNSMFTNIFARDFYIRNILNVPLYTVHSDLDDLRPIQQTRIIIDELSKTSGNILYKEYIGYQHYDKHLDKDLPFTPLFINSTSRNPFQTLLMWETYRPDIYNMCRWLKITGVDTASVVSDWYRPLNFKSYDKRSKQYFKDREYYYKLNKCSAIKASYNNNVFNIQSYRVKKLVISVNPVMVNLEQPVIVNLNGKKVFEGKITADKRFLTESFKIDFDRGNICVNEIRIKTGKE
ncbi:hypothetical protein [Mucilaginibacter gracilis]|nr:hypothetical protein [Mucilaginibacter gracilis]